MLAGEGSTSGGRTSMLVYSFIYLCMGHMHRLWAYGFVPSGGSRTRGRKRDLKRFLL